MFFVSTPSRTSTNDPLANSIPDVYTAATVLIAARICPPVLLEVTEAALSRSWEHSIALLEAFGPQSSSARRCIAALEVLSEKVAMQHPAGAAQPTAGIPLPTQNRSAMTNPPGASEETNDAATIVDIGLMNPTDMGWLNSVPFDFDGQFPYGYGTFD